MRFFYSIFLLTCIFIGMQAKTFALDVPLLQGRINDYAHVLSPQSLQQLENQLKHQEDSTTNQIVLLTISSLEGQPIEEFANKVFNTWKLGKASNDNGVLLLVAVDDHKLRIEVGYGLEHKLTDALSNRIIRNVITPYFKEQNYEAGIFAGVQAIVGAVDGTYIATAEDTEEEQELTLREQLWIGVPMMFMLLVFTAIIIFIDLFAPDLKISWYLFLFILIFYLVFPPVIFGSVVGFGIAGAYVIFFLLSRLYFSSKRGENMVNRFQTSKFMTASVSSGTHSTRSSSSSTSSSSSSWSSDNSSWSSGSSDSSSSYSGDGGSSGGGGSSGSW